MLRYCKFQHPKCSVRSLGTELKRREYLSKQQQGAQLDFKLSMVIMQHDTLSGTLLRRERTINSHTGTTGVQWACLRLTGTRGNCLYKCNQFLRAQSKLTVWGRAEEQQSVFSFGIQVVQNV